LEGVFGRGGGERNLIVLFFFLFLVASGASLIRKEKGLLGFTGASLGLGLKLEI
jgi:hypothetical protein